MKKSKGFTLAELLIVVAIIAVLVAIAIPVFTSQLVKAREAADEANVRSYYAECVVDVLGGEDDAAYPDAYDGATLNYEDKLTWEVDDDGALTVTYSATKIPVLELTGDPITD